MVRKDVELCYPASLRIFARPNSQISFVFFKNNNSHIPLEESSFFCSCAAPLSQALLLGCLGHLSLSSSPLCALHNSSQHAETFRLKPRQENGGFASCCLNQGADVWCKRNGAWNQFKWKRFALTILTSNLMWIFACIGNDSDPETIGKSFVSLRITNANFSYFLTRFPLYLLELTVLHNLNIRISQFLVWLEVKMYSFKLPASIFRASFFLSFWIMQFCAQTNFPMMQSVL